MHLNYFPFKQVTKGQIKDARSTHRTGLFYSLPWWKNFNKDAVLEYRIQIVLIEGKRAVWDVEWPEETGETSLLCCSPRDLMWPLLSSHHLHQTPCQSSTLLVFQTP